MIREAAAYDVGLLFEMEKQASTTALAHIFSADLDFPDDDVLARWALVVAEPGVTVLVDEDGPDPVGYAAFGDGWLRHFGVVPSWWGTGRAQQLHAEVMERASRAGYAVASLWVLVDNVRARAFYGHLGWRDSGIRDVEVFAPYPVKMRMDRP